MAIGQLVMLDGIDEIKQRQNLPAHIVHINPYFSLRQVVAKCREVHDMSSRYLAQEEHTWPDPSVRLLGPPIEGICDKGTVFDITFDVICPVVQPDATDNDS